MSDDDIRSALHRATPELRVPDGIVDGAVRRRRRTRNLVAGGALAAVAALVLPLALTLGDDDSLVAEPAPVESTAVTGETPSPEVVPTAAEALPESGLTSASGTPYDPAGDDLIPPVCADLRAASGLDLPIQTIPDGGFPAGATAVWLCGEPGPPFDGRLGAREPLTTDVAGFVEFLGDRPEVAPDQVCSAEYGLSYLLVIEYPDSETAAIEGGLHGCHTVGGRAGAQEVWDEATRRWEEQRAAQDLTYTGQPDLCVNSYREPEGIRNGLASVWGRGGTDAVRGVICGLPADATSFQDEVAQRDLPDDLVADLADAFAGQPVEGPGWADALLPYLVLLNRYGDPTTVYLQPDGQAVVDGWDQFELTGSLRARVLAETEGLRAERFAVIPEACSTSYEDPRAQFADVVSGVVCTSPHAVPELGPELPPEVAVEIAQRFDEEAVTNTGGYTGYSVVLTDGEGGRLRLESSSSDRLVDAETNRMWPIPDDILAELTRRGFNAETQ